MIKHTFDDRYTSKVNTVVFAQLHFFLGFGLLLRDLIAFQSQQARLATLYLPLFGLLQENVNRLNVKEVSPFTVNHSNNVRVPPCGLKQEHGLVYAVLQGTSC